MVMAIVVPCIKGKLGNTEYFATKMAVRELVTGVRPACELDDWAKMTIGERMQRDPDKKRIEKELAPYIAKTQDRFFGSIIVLVYNGEIHFERLKDLGAKIPQAYLSAAKDLGFISIDGGSLIVLDGQHRLLALEKVFKGEVSGEFAKEIPNDEISVIFIRHENSEKTRRIFNKVNKYAKSTSRGDNIITSEDDAHAILSRMFMAEEEPLGITYLNDKGKEESIVNWRNNTLSQRSLQFTTISTLNDTIKFILKNENIIISEQIRPSDKELEEYYEISKFYWETVLEGITPYKDSLSDVTKMPEMRKPSSPFSLLFKPAAQLALFKGLIAAKELGLPLEEAVKRINHIDWSMSSDIWRDIIVRSNITIDPKSEAQEKAANLITYLIAAEYMSVELKDQIKKVYNQARGNKNELLPLCVMDKIIK